MEAELVRRMGSLKRLRPIMLACNVGLGIIFLCVGWDIYAQAGADPFQAKVGWFVMALGLLDVIVAKPLVDMITTFPSDSPR